MSTYASLPRSRAARLAVLLVVAAVGSAGCSGISGDLIAYDLPPEEARYTLEVDSDGVHTQWEYISSRPAQDETPEHRPCVLSTQIEAPCRPEPLIFLRYDLGLDLDNTVPAVRPHAITVTGYYQALDSPPEVTDLSLEVTFNGGETWTSVRTRPVGDGEFRARIRHPRLEDTNGEVGLRVTAADSDGNTVEQTIPEAYGLSG